MRKMMIAAVTSLSLLAGCSTTQITDFLGQVQADAAAACLFVPTIETILAVAQSLGFAPAAIGGAAIQTVANAICSQVPKPASARFRALPLRGIGPAVNVGNFNGVQINGWRTP